MDSYSKDIHLQSKGYAADLSNSELSSLERDHEERQPRFGVDEPLEVQLRFELGSLVDSHVLIDTDGQRESHWDFVRQEQGRFQTSSEENTPLLSHDKQDDLKSFDNCESWPRSTSQMDTQLFIDAQDDVNMMNEVFGGKDKNMVDLEDDRGLLLPSTHRQCEEETVWIGEEKEVLEEKAHNSWKEGVVDEAVEVSQVSVEKLDARVACESSADYGESIQSQEDEHRENREAGRVAADFVKEHSLNKEQSSLVDAAFQVCQPQCSVLTLLSDEANPNQELLPECSKRDLVDSIEPEYSGIDDVEVYAQTEIATATEEVNRPADGAQVFHDSKRELEMDTAGSKTDVEANVDDKIVISESLGMESDSDLVSRTSLTKESQELSTETVIQSSEHLVETACIMLDTCEKATTPGGSCLDNPPGGSRLESESVLTDRVEKQSDLQIQSTEMDSEVEASQGVAADNISGPETIVLSLLEASTTYENAVGKVVASCEELKKRDEANDKVGETLDSTLQTASNVSANELAVDSTPTDVTAIATMPAEIHEIPATRVLEQGCLYECSDEGGVENTSSVNSLEQAEDTQGIPTVADLSVVGTRPSHEDILGSQPFSAETPQVSDGHGDLEPADNNMKSLESTVEGSLDPKESGEPDNALCNVVTFTDSSSKELVEKQVGAQGASDCFRQEQVANDGNKPMLQELKSKQQSGEQNASDFSPFSAKPSLSNEDMISTEVSHSGGILHVLLDVHKEGLIDESLPKNAIDQDHSKMIESEGLTDAPTSNRGDATQQDFINSGAKLTEGCSDTYVSGSAGQAVTSGSHEDPNYGTPPQEKSGNRKADASTRNNRLKDSARASPLQARSDQEQKSAGTEGLGRRKTTPKTATQRNGIEPEGFSSPKKSGAKITSGRKKGVVSPMVQDALVSPAAKEGSQTPASITKSVFSVNARHHASPDINGLDVTVPMVSPTQPFTEPQQVQLRAQILVYGSLIQGAAPEETLMVAAFSNATGVQVGRDPEASGRAVWEKQWQATVDRIHAKSSRDVQKDSSRANSALVSNFPIATTKVSEGGVKPNGSSGMATITIDGRNTAVSPVSVPDVSGTKGQASRSKQSADPALDVSGSRNSQTVAAAAPPGPITSTASRSASSSLNESLSQSAKSRADSQQLTPHTYFPTPPQGPFLTGTPPWFSTATFPGSWMPQTQAAVYSGPPAHFTHSQAGVTSDQALETRRSTPSSSGTVMPVTSFGPTLFTPVVGGLSVTPTSLSDPLQNKQPVSDSRPRKRKKTQCETNVPSADVNPSYATGTAPCVGIQALSTSYIPTGQACPGISSHAYSAPPTASQALALVVANTHLPKSNQETSTVVVHTNEVSAPSSTIMPSAGPLSNEKQIENSVNLRNSTNHLLQAQASAEEAASVAASALSESESLWSKIKAQKNAGFTPDIELQLVSSAAAMATAASVAKAAAAAAKAAYEAAVQVKRISEGVLEVGKQANEPHYSRLLGDNGDNASQPWRLPESSNSILAAARMASKQRLEAVSAARIKAESFESVVRAAELATNAISQVGVVMTMGESAPFTLEMLLEAGPEGLHRLEEKVKTKPKGTAIQSPGRRGTPTSTEREKKFTLKITSGGNKDAQLDNWTSDSIMAARPENDTRIISELEVGVMTELSKQKTTDHLAASIPASRQGLLTSRAEGGLIYEQEVSVADNKIVKGSLVEVMSDEKGLRGVWFSATVQSVDGEKVSVLYDDLLADDGYSPLEEWIHLKGSSGKAPRIRLAHPNKNVGFEGTRKRRREALGSHKWSVGDRVDAWIREGWWEGEIKEIIEDGESKAKVFFPEDGDTSLVKTSKLRPSLVWSNGHWVLWHESKQGKKELSRARIATHEGETPLAKRQKTEKAQPSCSVKQKLVPASIAEVSAIHKDASLFDSNTANLPTVFKGFTVDGLDKPKQQGSKVVFGVPRPTKKRKLVEVSKHFGSVKGVTGTSTVKVSNNKNEDTSVYAPGVSEASRLDGLKAKKRVLHNPKVRPYKDTDSDAVHLKASGIRSKKDKPFVATKAPLRKNPPNREGLLSLSKNRDGKVIKKKELPSNKNQPESQEQPENRALASNVPILETHTSSIAGEDIGKESSVASQNNETPSDAVKESGTELPQAAQEIDNNQMSALSHKEKVKQPSQQVKDTPANGNKLASQSLKKKETQPSEDNEEVAHSGKESQKVSEKGSESQPVHEGEKELEVSSEKQSAVLLNDGEKYSAHPTKELEKSKEVGKPGSETWEPRRTSRKIQPTSKLLEGLQTASKLGKNSSSHDRGSRGGSKAASQP